MSVLIRGMEMPKNCAECPVNLYVCQRGYEYLLEHPELYDQRAEDCPISYVPEHGRLIDADALIIALETQDYSCAPDTLEEWTPMDMTKAEIADIRNAPTIIPEEGE